jgi:hypothetical protein
MNDVLERIWKEAVCYPSICLRGLYKSMGTLRQAERPLEPRGFPNWLLRCEVEVLRRFGGTYCFDLQG